MDYIELDSDLLLLAAEGSHYSRMEVMSRIQDMKARERELLRQAIDRLDAWLDEVTLEMHQRKTP